MNQKEDGVNLPALTDGRFPEDVKVKHCVAAWRLAHQVKFGRRQRWSHALKSLLSHDRFEVTSIARDLTIRHIVNRDMTRKAFIQSLCHVLCCNHARCKMLGSTELCMEDKIIFIIVDIQPDAAVNLRYHNSYLPFVMRIYQCIHI
jgi:hypothetical protein